MRTFAILVAVICATAVSASASRRQFSIEGFENEAGYQLIFSHPINWMRAYPVIICRTVIPGNPSLQYLYVSRSKLADATPVDVSERQCLNGMAPEGYGRIDALIVVYYHDSELAAVAYIVYAGGLPAYRGIDPGYMAVGKPSGTFISHDDDTSAALLRRFDR